MNSRMQELLAKLKSSFEKLLRSVEESSLFERLMMRYDSLEHRHQQQIKLALSGAGILLGVLIVLLPLVNAVAHRHKIREYRDLTSDIRGLGRAERMKVLSTQRAQGFSELPAASLDELEMSLEQFLANIGIPAEFYTLTKEGSGFKVQVQELSIRQLSAFIFQIDAWYPKLGFKSLKTAINSEAKEMLTMDASIYFGNAEFSGEAETDFGDSSGANEIGDSDTPSAPNDVGSASPPPPSSDSGFSPPPPPMDLPQEDSTDFEPPPPPLPPEFEDGGDGDLPPPAFFEEE